MADEKAQASQWIQGGILLKNLDEQYATSSRKKKRRYDRSEEREYKEL